MPASLHLPRLIAFGLLLTLSGCHARQEAVKPAVLPVATPLPIAPAPVLTDAQRAAQDVKAAQDRYIAWKTSGGDAPHRVASDTAPSSPNPDTASDERDYREAMSILISACHDQGYEVIWPHDGDENVMGVLMDEGDWPDATKKGFADMFSQEFSQRREQNNQVGPYKTIVRFLPSGDTWVANGNTVK